MYPSPNLRSIDIHHFDEPVNLDLMQSYSSIMSSLEKIDIPFIALDENAVLPTKNDGDVGWDLYSVDEVNIKSLEFKVINTGLTAILPHGLNVFIWDRSGLSSKFGLHRFAGVIDSSFRGSWKICLFNGNKIEDFLVKKGQKIAQFVLQWEVPVNVCWGNKDDLEKNQTERGEKGFGSSDFNSFPKSIGTPELKNGITAQTTGQKEYCRAIAEYDITICTGPSGTGKTMVAAGLASEYLISGKCEKILVTRPCIESGRHLGALPGILDEKFNPFIDPIYEYLVYFLGETKYKEFVKNKQIVVRPIEYLRGLTFHKTFMCLDEAQNCTFTQLKMFLTRMGEDSKVVINGDITQTDLHQGMSGLSLVIEKLKNIEEIAIIQLSNLDILRNSLIKKIVVALN